MPYIPLDDRGECNNPVGAGQLNYKLFSLCLWYWQTNGRNYQAFNDILGALEGCKLELYRRHVAPYEDKKIEENGDIY